MGFKENEITKKVMLDLSQHGFVLFRNNSGKYSVTENGKERFISYGVGNTVVFAGSDIIGFREVSVMNSSFYGAEFVAIECKTKKGKLTKKQANFLRMVKNKNGYCAVAREDDSLDGYKLVMFDELDKEIQEAMG